MMSVENGVLAAAKNPAMPMITKLAGCGTRPGHAWWNTVPTAPPVQPPMTIAGPNTPPDPPLPIVRLVVRILPRATATSTPADKLASFHRPSCSTPYPVDTTASTVRSRPNRKYSPTPRTPVREAPRTGFSKRGPGSRLNKA
jgi:hypothetical protein